MAELKRCGFYVRPSDGSQQFHQVDNGAYCEFREAMFEIERLRAALERYGQHIDHCVGAQFDPVTMTTVDACTCGFTAALMGSETEVRDG